jgi:ligand-binding sensor domain-containing protein
LAYTVFFSGGAYTAYVVTSISPGIDGSVWFGLDGGGVRRYHSGSTNKVWQTYLYPSIPFNSVSGVSADIIQVGDVWVSTAIGGISRYVPSTTEPDEGTWRSYSTANVPQMPTNTVICSAYDIVTNSVWFGTFNRGVFSFRVDNSGLENWSSYELPPEFGGPVVSIAFDLSKTVWLAKNAGPGAGVSSYNPVSGVTHHYTNATTGGKIPASGVKAVVTDFGSTRWFGTNEGLVRLRDTTWTVFNTSNTSELPNNMINALLIDRRGNLWIGTNDGIAVFNEYGTRF